MNFNLHKIYFNSLMNSHKINPRVKKVCDKKARALMGKNSTEKIKSLRKFAMVYII